MWELLAHHWANLSRMRVATVAAVRVSGRQKFNFRQWARGQCMTASLCGLYSSVKGRFDILLLTVECFFKPEPCPGTTHKEVFCCSRQNPAT